MPPVRVAIAQRLLGELEFSAQPHTGHLWLKLPPSWSSAASDPNTEFESQRAPFLSYMRRGNGLWRKPACTPEELQDHKLHEPPLPQQQASDHAGHRQEVYSCSPKNPGGKTDVQHAEKRKPGLIPLGCPKSRVGNPCEKGCTGKACPAHWKH